MESNEKFCNVFRSVALNSLSTLSYPSGYKYLFDKDKTLLMFMRSTGSDEFDPEDRRVENFFRVLHDTLLIMNAESTTEEDTFVSYGSYMWLRFYKSKSSEDRFDISCDPQKPLDKVVEVVDKLLGAGAEEEKEDEDDLSAYKPLKSSISSYITTVVNSLSKLYESGYGFGSRTGLLTSEGIVTCTPNGERVYVGSLEERIKEISLFESLKSYFGDKYGRFSAVDEEPTLEGISQGPKVYTDLHLKAMFGYFAFCKGKTTGLRAYMTKNNIPHEGMDRAKKWSYVKGWLSELTESYFLKAIKEDGIPPYSENQGMLLSEYMRINTPNIVSVCERLADTMKLAFVVTQRQVKKSDGSLINLTVRVPSFTEVDMGEVSNIIENAFNVGGSTIVNVESVGLSDGVYEFTVIFDKKAYSQDMLFAHMMIDTLKGQGIKPSWDNAVLGRDMEEGLFQYDFKNEQNFFICMYGSSGSGKGVMTMNLLSSALADDCFVTYMDAKPDTAVALAGTTWSRGKDGVIYSGPGTDPTFTLENSGPCPRSSDRFISKQYIPEGMFGSDTAGLDDFIEVTLYYRGLELILELCVQRFNVSNQGSGAIKNGHWMVSVFDELQKVASAEANVREKLKSIKKKRSEAKEKYTDPKGNQKERKVDVYSDPIWCFVDDWENWMNDIANKFVAGCKATFRKAEITFIFIWQTNTFPGSDVKTCALARALQDSSGAAIKMIGRGALKYAQDGGSTTWGTPKCEWYDSKFTGAKGGYWAVGGDPWNSMKVFKPYNVYSNLDRDKVVSNAAKNGLSETDLIGIALNPDGSIMPEIAFDGYATKLLGMYGLDPATQFQACRDYVEGFVKSKGLASSLDDFMYNFKGHTQGNEGGLAIGASGVPQGISYISDGGSNEEDYSDPEKVLCYTGSGDLFKDDYTEDGSSEGSYEEDSEDIPLWGEDAVVNSNIQSNSEVGKLPVEIQNYIKNLESQLQSVMELLEKTGYQGTPVNNGTYKGSDEAIPDYVTAPINGSANIDLGKEIGSMNFDADDITCVGDLMTKVTESAYAVFGDFSTYNSLRIINKNFYINDRRFNCKIDARYAMNIPYDIRLKVNAGDIADLFNYNTIYAMKNLRVLEVTDENVFFTYIVPQMGCSDGKDCITTLFRELPQLQAVKVGKRIFTANNFDDSLKGINNDFGYKYSRTADLAWGSNAFFAKVFRKSRSLAAASLDLGKNPVNGSNCEKFLSRHGILRAGAKVGGTVVGTAGLLAGGAGFLASGALGLGNKAYSSVKNGVRKSSIKNQTKSFTDGLKDLWNN
jgi:hypothetical protein